jgi:hypothetical protein
MRAAGIGRLPRIELWGDAKMTKLPAAWMPDADMRRIHFHWTAGSHEPNATDLNAYHILIRGDGKPVRGTHSIAANAPGAAGPRANHTLNANTGAIGVSLCCMLNAEEHPFDPGPAPMTREQWDAGIAILAQLAKRYGIPVTPQTILTHAEVQPNLNIPQKGKWDITRLAFDPDVRGHQAVGDLMRRGVAAQLDALLGTVEKLPSEPDLKLPVFRVHGVAPSRLNVRRNPDGEKVGSLPEGTKVERLAIIDGWWQVRTSGGYVGWVWSSFLRAA